MHSLSVKFRHRISNQPGNTITKYNVYKSAELIKSVMAADINDAIELVGMWGATVRDEMAFQWFTLGEKSYAVEIIPADQA